MIPADLNRMESIEGRLIRLLRTDSEAAFQEVYDMYSARIYRFSLVLLKDTGWSEDIVQEVFVKLWKSRRQLDVNKDLWVYLYVLTKRTALNKLRDIETFSSSFDLLWENISRLGDSPDEKLINKELGLYLEKILGRLPERQREVFRLSRFEGYTHQQIAEKLNISPNTVKNHLIQALKTIRSLPLDINYFLFILFMSL